jgi:catalase
MQVIEGFGSGLQAPRFPVHHYHKNGPMRFFDNNAKNPDAYYEPNSFNGPKEDKRYAEPPLPLTGDADRYNHRARLLLRYTNKHALDMGEGRLQNSASAFRQRVVFRQALQDLSARRGHD